MVHLCPWDCVKRQQHPTSTGVLSRYPDLRELTRTPSYQNKVKAASEQITHAHGSWVSEVLQRFLSWRKHPTWDHAA